MDGLDGLVAGVSAVQLAFSGPVVSATGAVAVGCRPGRVPVLELVSPPKFSWEMLAVPSWGAVVATALMTQPNSF